jgi:putative aldouronate transport system permease protein
MSNARVSNNGERIFEVVNGLLLIGFCLLMVYPFLYTLNLSFSDVREAMAGGFFLTPQGFSLSSYRMVFRSSYIWTGYANTLIVTGVGTVLSLAVTSLMSYALSKRSMPGHRFWNRMIVFTMMFHGGLIPTFLVMRATGLYNTRLALMMIVLVTPFNAIILRNFFAHIPESLEESARMDGANDLLIFFRIVIPLSKAALATISLWIAVAHWNDFFHCLVYIRDRSKFVVQLVLREIVNSVDFEDYLNMDEQADALILPATMKGAAIMVVTVPILCFYPFLQKYFVKGVLIGSVKG